MFCIIYEKESPRISCPEYIEDLDICVKMYQRQCQSQIHRVPPDREILKKWDFQENISIFMKFKNSKGFIGNQETKCVV